MVIFVSGDPHWAEFMAKRMPASEVWGAEQTLYEVTASGIPQNLPGFYLNSNRFNIFIAVIQIWIVNTLKAACPECQPSRGGTFQPELSVPLHLQRH